MQKYSSGIHSTDKGWAWMIMLGAMLWNTGVSGTLKSFGILYLEFINVFNASPTQASWIGFVFSLMMLLLSPISGYIGDHYSPRWILIIGGIIAATGVFLTGFAPSITYAVVSYGVIAGGAIGIMDGPIFGTLNKYFKKKKSFANSMAFVGAGIGCLIMPVILTLCIEIYTIRGSLFILAGIWLHACVIGALYRPINPIHQESLIIEITNPEKGHDKNSSIRVLCETDSFQQTGQDTNPHLQNIVDTKSHVANKGLQLNFSGDKQNTSCETSTNSMQAVHQEQVANNIVEQCKCEEEQDDTGKHASINQIQTCCNHTEQTHKNDSMCYHSSDQINRFAEFCSDWVKNNHTCVHSHSKIQDMNHKLSISTKNVHRDDHPCAMRDINSQNKNKLFKALRDYIDFLSNARMLRTVFAIMFGSIAYFTQMFLFPAIAEELEFSKMQGAMFVSMTGITEICSRIPLGYISDKHFVNKGLIVSVLSVVTFVLAIIVSFVPNRLVLSIYCGILGVTGGTIVPLAMPLLVDVVPCTRISSAAGLFLFAMGIAFAIGPPLSGAVKMWTGSYLYSLQVCISMYIPTAILLMWNVIAAAVAK